MIISRIEDGIGNQLFRYAAGRRLAHKWNTEFKIDVSAYDIKKNRAYVLDQFNISATVATPEEIEQIKNLHNDTGSGKEIQFWNFMPEVLYWSDNLYLSGAWEDERYFADISDIIRQEFTLKNPLSASAQLWKEKILAAECSVSIHFRHGDFLHDPKINHSISNSVLPLDYYYECINRLKCEYQNLKLFVFSDNVQWVKKNLQADVPTEYISGSGVSDVEELYLMSLCKHNIIANSTFSWWAAWLNQNPDKKVFVPVPASIFGTKKLYRFARERNENSPFDSDKWIRVLFESNERSEITMRPYFSMLLVVDDDAETIQETLDALLSQDYKFYELIIIDNASTDGSDKICRQIVKAHDNVTFISLCEKISNGAAWNKALDLAQGEFVMFLTGKDRLLNDTLSFFYLINRHSLVDIVYSAKWIQENEHGDIDLDGQKFSLETDSNFIDLKDSVGGNFDKLIILKILSESNAAPLATKVFKRKFLMDNGIKFNDKLDDNDAELFFTVEAMFQANEIIFSPKVFYVAPKNF